MRKNTIHRLIAANLLLEFRDLLPLVLPSEGVLVRAKEFHLTRGVGFKGTMNALFLKDLAEKTHRGLRRRVEAGKRRGPRE
jgi:site-specific DNA recombinase